MAAMVQHNIPSARSDHHLSPLLKEYLPDSKFQVKLISWHQRDVFLFSCVKWKWSPFEIYLFYIYYENLYKALGLLLSGTEISVWESEALSCNWVIYLYVQHRTIQSLKWLEFVLIISFLFRYANLLPFKHQSPRASPNGWRCFRVSDTTDDSERARRDAWVRVSARGSWMSPGHTWPLITFLQQE